MCCVFADQNTQHTWLKFRCKSHLTWKHYVSFCNSKIGQTKLVQPVLVQIKMFRFYNRATSKPVHNNVKKNYYDDGKLWKDQTNWGPKDQVSCILWVCVKERKGHQIESMVQQINSISVRIITRIDEKRGTEWTECRKKKRGPSF